MAGTHSSVGSGTNPKAWTKKEWKQIKSNSMGKNKFADRLFEQIEAAPALISKDDVQSIENVIARDAFRRAALLFATSSGAELCRQVEGDREFACAVAHVQHELGNVVKRYRELADLLDVVNTRLLLSLCSREDMQEILDAVGRKGD
ncbi:hypothetical protein KDW20_24915 [Burkholderia cenocepacia]|uniref:hypothetical protein n=1 Tax=Burkholderia cenocepacia TaxID=95486 RepID=UPI001B987E61|nr:hypothetical protein [Burkholderia cenocepacia]MBR8379014.1 hypothetical protein [Burkholderia cenocepacia]